MQGGGVRGEEVTGEGGEVVNGAGVEGCRRDAAVDGGGHSGPVSTPSLAQAVDFP